MLRDTSRVSAPPTYVAWVVGYETHDETYGLALGLAPLAARVTSPLKYGFYVYRIHYFELLVQSWCAAGEGRELSRPSLRIVRTALPAAILSQLRGLIFV